MNVPTLGELALQARLLSAGQLEDALRYQRQNYLEGDFRRLGELLVDYARCSRAAIRSLLQRQGITVVECALCETRYNALMFRGQGMCLRCGRRLKVSEANASLTVEDAISGGGPRADHLLIEYRQRDPRIGRYEILGEVGRGGMGVIYKALDAQLQRYVALKFLRPYDDISDEDKERFRREARAIAQLRHENIVQAYAIEEVQGLNYMAMDFVQGVPMDILFNQGALSPEEVVQISIQVSRGLHYAHESGIVHRDVKPANIVIDRTIKPYLVDFGIAKMQSDSMSLTTEGEVLGSLAYMAPEYVAKGKAVLDRRCDVYGVGVVLYEAVTRGKLPYGDPDDDMMIMRLVKEPPIPVEKQAPGLDANLAKIINRAINKDRKIRHDTAEELAQDLEQWLHNKTHGSNEQVAGVDPMADVFSRTGEDFVPLEVADPGLEPQAGPSRGLQVILIALLVALAGVGIGWGMSLLTLREEVRTWKRKAGNAELRAARALHDGGDFDEALKSYDRAVEMLPDDPNPLKGRARLKERLRDIDGAKADRLAADALSAKTAKTAK